MLASSQAISVPTVTVLRAARADLHSERHLGCDLGVQAGRASHYDVLVVSLDCLTAFREKVAWECVRMKADGRAF